MRLKHGTYYFWIYKNTLSYMNIKTPKVIANWKMNLMPHQACDVVENIIDLCPKASSDIIICPPYTHLYHLKDLIKNNIFLGAQNCHDKTSGAYTGEISALMLADLGVSYVILGHSERRELGPYENLSIKAKIRAAFSAGLHVVYCCGEPDSMREAGNHEDYVLKQLSSDLFDFELSELTKLSIAYEPIWAIGTGKTASPEEAQAMHLFIRNTIFQQFGSGFAHSMSILYGGSVKANNAGILAFQNDIDGFLVGGASLDPNEFAAIVNVFL